ncbi:MAG: SDR family oxidoreductase [Blastocatellia bacterium]|nr:SDR family oxidoreductase [Blastocatellia bacterium]
MILVVGATGFLGGEICRRLTQAGQSVRGLVRATSDPNITANLQELGVQLATGDLKDKASLVAACQGITSIISTATVTRSSQPGDSIELTDAAGQQALIAAALEAGVSQFIYVSYSGQIGTDDPLTLAKRGVEERLRASGMTYTILRPSYFIEAWLSPVFGFDAANAKATIYGAGENKLSWISLGEVAAFAVESLTNPAARNAVLELGGPNALSPLEVVRIFEEISGKQFDVQHVPEEALIAQQANATDSMQRAFAALMLAYAKGDVIPMEATLQQFPIALTSVREFAQRTV